MLNFKPDLFLEVAELNRFQEFLKDEGFQRLVVLNTEVFGIPLTLNNPDNFLIGEGTTAGTIKVSQNSYAIDNLGRIIFRKEEDNITLPAAGTWYWIVAKHKYSTLEEGVVSVDSSGNLVGVDTFFTEVLRGQPNFPAKIKFYTLEGEVPGSNTGEYEVLEVIDNTTAILQGVLTNATDLKIAVVGTFTPGASIPTNNKFPFQYDSCIAFTEAEGGLVAAGGGADPTPLIPGDGEYKVAAVKGSGGSVEIRDYRYYYRYQSKPDFIANYISAGENPLLGIEKIYYPHRLSARESLVYVAWAFTGTTWAISSPTQITITVGTGGKYKSVADAVTGDFDGWRLYSYDGNYVNIITSTAGGASIILDLDNVPYVAFSDDTKPLIIAPNVDQIELRDVGVLAISDYEFLPTEKLFTFPINSQRGIMEVEIFLSEFGIPDKHKLFYRYIKGGVYTQSEYYLMPDDSTNGYYDEDQFEIGGEFRNGIVPTRTTYSDGEYNVKDNELNVGLGGNLNNKLISLNYSANMDGGKANILTPMGGHSILFDCQSSNITLEGIKELEYFNWGTNWSSPKVGTEVVVRFINGTANSSLKLGTMTSGGSCFVPPSLEASTAPARQIFTLNDEETYVFKYMGAFNGVDYKWLIKECSSRFEKLITKTHIAITSFGPSWGAGSPAPYANKVLGNLVVLQGQISLTSDLAATSPVLLCTLPVGFRPSVVDTYFWANVYVYNDTVSWYYPIPAWIQSDGDVYLLAEADNPIDFKVFTKVYLDNVTFFNAPLT